jgi:glycosyltransferase involved in cell wall biosynthesis
MPRPKISIVIPSYNRAEYISSTLNSILAQTYKDFEIIFVDDGSTDNTEAILQSYMDKDYRVKYFKQSNSERAVARTYGMSLAIGDYICLVDSDDVWYPHKLETQFSFMEANADYLLCYASVNRIDMQGRKLAAATRQLEGYTGWVFFELLKRNFIPSVTPMFRKEVLKKVKEQNTEYIPYEDWDFWLRLSREGKFYHIREPLGAYRLHPGQSVQNVNAERIEKVTKAVLDSNTHLENFDLQDYMDRSGISLDLTTFLQREFSLIVNEAYSLANLRFSYWYLISGNLNMAKHKLKLSSKLSEKRAYDYRWWGLKLVTILQPYLGNILPKFLGSFH